MCVMSMIFDHYHDKWGPLIQQTVPPVVVPGVVIPPAQPLVSREEVEEFHRLLERAREYDRHHNQPDCELDEKRQALQRLAEQLGVKIAFL